jgi:hypothetical protein
MATSRKFRPSKAYANGYTRAFEGLRADDDLNRPDLVSTSAFEAYQAGRARAEYNQGYLDGDAARRATPPSYLNPTA